jgi:hypothetical protein
MSSLSFELASERDDVDLRRLLRENPIPGSISVSFEREPCYFDASIVEGEFHQTIVARESDTGTVIALGNRSVRPLFVNGQRQDIGYMSQLRVNPKYGKGMYLARGLAGGFRKYRELHGDGHAPFYLMSVIEDNLPARRLLTSGLPDYPHAREYTRLFTYAVYPTRRKRDLPLPSSLRIIRGDATYADEIVDCLNRNNVCKQFAPYWTCDSLFPSRSRLSPADFFLILYGKHILGCLACWDQSAFKQTVVRGYSGSLARWRKVINFFSQFGLLPYLPEPNTPLRYSYVCHLAIDDDNPVIFEALLRTAYNHNLEQGYNYFMIGLAESNPLRSIVETYRPLTYISQIYLVDWDENGDLLAKIDGRIPGLEIALL